MKRGSVIVMLRGLRNCKKLARVSKGFSGDWTLEDGCRWTRSIGFVHLRMPSCRLKNETSLECMHGGLSWSEWLGIDVSAEYGGTGTSGIHLRTLGAILLQTIFHCRNPQKRQKEQHRCTDGCCAGESVGCRKRKWFRSNWWEGWVTRGMWRGPLFSLQTMKPWGRRRHKSG